MSHSVYVDHCVCLPPYLVHSRSHQIQVICPESMHQSLMDPKIYAYDEWYKEKLRERKVKEWTGRFKESADTRNEWQKTLRAYYQSDIWAEVRKQALNYADYKCQGCGAIVLNPSSLDVHHRTYERIGGNEKIEDLQVLCFPCHGKADRERDRSTEERRRNSRYQNRLFGFAYKKYGEGWQYEHTERDVEIGFITFLYKQHCKESELDFDPNFDTETDLDFLEFWNMVIDGDH